MLKTTYVQLLAGARAARPEMLRELRQTRGELFVALGSRAEERALVWIGQRLREALVAGRVVAARSDVDRVDRDALDRVALEMLTVRQDATPSFAAAASSA